MAVRALLAASLSVAALVASASEVIAAPRMDNVCKSVDALGNVRYYDCPPRTTYSAPKRAPRPIVEEAPVPAPTPVSPITTEPPQPARRLFPGLGGVGSRATYPIAGIPLLFTGAVVALAAAISFLAAAFRVSLWWGLGCTLVSPVSPVFVVLHWDVARRPFLTSLAGLAAALAGYYILGGGG